VGGCTIACRAVALFNLLVAQTKVPQVKGASLAASGQVKSENLKTYSGFLNRLTAIYPGIQPLDPSFSNN
jgi:hypothetical protein